MQQQFAWECSKRNQFRYLTLFIIKDVFPKHVFSLPERNNNSMPISWNEVWRRTSEKKRQAEKPPLCFSCSRQNRTATPRPRVIKSMRYYGRGGVLYNSSALITFVGGWVNNSTTANSTEKGGPRPLLMLLLLLMSLRLK